MDKFYRSNYEDSKWLGVCGGIGKFTDTDPTLIRIVFCISGLVCLPATFFIYVIIAMCAPREPEAK